MRIFGQSFWLSGFMVLGQVFASDLPAVSEKQIDFAHDVVPILETACTQCHGRGKSNGGFKLDTREDVLKGDVLVPGDSASSYLIELVAGIDPDNVMPQKGKRLTPEEVGLLRAWIDQGLPWDEGVFLGKKESVRIQPRRVSPPDQTGLFGSQNPIDRFMARYFEEKGIQPGLPVSDALFLKRVYLDIQGLLPGEADYKTFLADPDPEKRTQMVDRLLADPRPYAEHWLTFWNDLLRNDYRGTGFIDGGREQITSWLFNALVENLPYDRFVRELMDPVEGSRGFTKGIVWRGVVNASQKPEMQAAQNISQVFMGVNLKCASCHDSFINDWRLSDAYGLASIYAEDKMEMYQCDKPTGEFADLNFIYPELGTLTPDATRAERIKELAQIVTGPENGRLTRTIVNRLWARLMGRGLVEPVDEMDAAAWNEDLLDWLAVDLSDHDYDLKHTLATIMTSRTYQLPAFDHAATQDGEFVFTGPLVRRLSAEQFRDALGNILNHWYERPHTRVDLLAAREAKPSEDTSSQPILLTEPKWIWNRKESNIESPTGKMFFRKSFHLESVPEVARLVACADDSFTLYINGKKMVSGSDHKKPEYTAIESALQTGRNVVAVEAVNGSDKANPAGLMVYLILRDAPTETRSSETVGSDLATDSSWIWSSSEYPDWEKPDFNTEAWAQSIELGSLQTPPWENERHFKSGILLALSIYEIRASLVAADPLQTALGRPNREQVHTTRPYQATTLQALALTNGKALAEIIKAGADSLVKDTVTSPEMWMTRLYWQALGRGPYTQELALTRDWLGDSLSKNDMEDLIWSIAMHPEFQLIY